MNEKTRQVLAGWLRLTDADRREVEEEIARYRRRESEAPRIEKRALDEVIANRNTIQLGPVGGGCPCCGR